MLDLGVLLPVVLSCSCVVLSRLYMTQQRYYQWGAPQYCILTAQYSDHWNSFPKNLLFRHPNIPTPQYWDTYKPTIPTPKYSDTFTIFVLIAALGLGLQLELWLEVVLGLGEDYSI